jgi:hypothetical protein
MLQPVIRPTARTCDKGKFASPFNTICRFTYSHAKISLAPSGKSVVLVCASRPTRGALRDRHECWARDAMGALVSLDEWHRCARRNRVVLISRRWDQVSRSIREATVAIKPRSPGRARISRKAIARGMPVAPAEPVVTAACFFCCRRAMGAASIRHSLRPLSLRGRDFCKTRAHSRRENAGSYLPGCLTIE